MPRHGDSRSKTTLSTIVLEKIDDWLNAGTSEVWIVDPKRKSIAVRRANEPERVLKGKVELSCESLLPGFRVAVAEIFR